MYGQKRSVGTPKRRGQLTVGVPSIAGPVSHDHAHPQGLQGLPPDPCQ